MTMVHRHRIKYLNKPLGARTELGLSCMDGTQMNAHVHAEGQAHSGSHFNLISTMNCLRARVLSLCSSFVQFFFFIVFFSEEINGPVYLPLGAD